MLLLLQFSFYKTAIVVLIVVISIFRITSLCHFNRLKCAQVFAIVTCVYSILKPVLQLSLPKIVRMGKFQSMSLMICLNLRRHVATHSEKFFTHFEIIYCTSHAPSKSASALLKLRAIDLLLKQKIKRISICNIFYLIIIEGIIECSKSFKIACVYLWNNKMFCSQYSIFYCVNTSGVP